MLSRIEHLVVLPRPPYVPNGSQVFFQLSVRDKSPGNHGMHDRNVGPVGLFADETIPQGALVMIDGGIVIQNIEDLPEDLKGFGSLIGENCWLVPSDFSQKPQALALNHSCSPTLARAGLFGYQAKQNIDPCQELTIDFAPFVATLTNWFFECGCGSSECRKIVRGTDWRNPSIARKLWSEWPPFIQKKILELKIFD